MNWLDTVSQPQPYVAEICKASPRAKSSSSSLSARLAPPRSAPGTARPLSQRVSRRDRDDWSSLLSSSGAYVAGKLAESTEKVRSGTWESGNSFSSRSGARESVASYPSSPLNSKSFSVANAHQCAEAVLGMLQSPKDMHMALQKAAAEAHQKSSADKAKSGEKVQISRLKAATTAAAKKRVAKPAAKPKKKDESSNSQNDHHTEGAIDSKTTTDSKADAPVSPASGDNPRKLFRKSSTLHSLIQAEAEPIRRLSMDGRELPVHRLSCSARGAMSGGIGSPMSPTSPRRASFVAYDKKLQDLLDKDTTHAAEVVEEGMRIKMGAKCFEADLSSFQDLVNCESNPVPIAVALENLQPLAGGGNFFWERRAEWGKGYGASLMFNLQLILWYPNCGQADVKTRVSSSVSFLHKPGCAYVYQPVLPVTSLQISPRSSFLPMFENDPRSFHTFKLAWRHYLDFGVSDYRIIVGEHLTEWTQKLKSLIEKPLNAVYWLMLMVGSHYRETLVRRSVLKGFEEIPERVPVICIDSFVSLSALLFSPERQVLYAGTDPTPSYLQWLQHIADQGSHRKDPQARRRLATAFEMNEVLDLAVIIVFFGRIQMKVKESAQLSWVGNPTLIKNYMRKYAEDNCCYSQLDQAIRLYTYSSALGEMPAEDGYHQPGSNETENWFCWNGLKVCEIGVPMPCTQATFLSPFITTKQIALLCPIHGPDAKLKPKQSKQPQADQGSVNPAGKDESSRRPSVAKDHDAAISARPSRPSSRSSQIEDSSQTPSVKEDSTKEDGSSEVDDTSSDEFDIFTESLDSALPGEGGGVVGRGAQELDTGDDRHCACARYVKMSDAEKKGRARRKHHGQLEEDPELLQALQSLGEYDVMHCFIAVLAGALNHAKQIIRLHFSIDPAAYTHLPMPGRVSWPDGMIPWYREFHRPDAHGRSRYGTLLESVVRGLIGDGYTSGLREEALDIVRSVNQETSHQEPEPVDLATLQMRAPEQDPRLGTTKKNANLDVQGGVRRASMFLGPQRNRSSSVMNDPTVTKDQESVPQQQGTLQLSAPSTASTTATLGSSSGLTHVPHIAGASGTGKQVRGVVSEIVLWTELYECESLYNHRSHFESFTQWCHSAHLVAFLKRCYRRCGVAGLLPGQRVGGLHVQGNPSYPLVLPTIANFPYGHGFPLHRVLEYFYGGVTTIVASITDQQAYEEMRAPLGLIAGQERLNNQCWFQLTPQEQEALNLIGLEVQQQQDSLSSQGGNLNQMLLKQLEDYISGGRVSTSVQPPQTAPKNQLGTLVKETEATTGATNNHGHGELHRGRSFTGMNGMAPDKATESSANAGHRKSGMTGTVGNRKATGNATTMPPTGSLHKKRPTTSNVGTLKKYERKGSKGALSTKRKYARAPPRLGTFVPEDSFFWFCSQNYALHTYPADKIPKHFLPDGSCLQCYYSDFISRTGTPEPSVRRALEHGVNRDPSMRSAEDWDGDPLEPSSRSICRPVVPPAVCLCQPTDLTSHNRQRWEVKKDFVDEQQLILGDACWWPGALGMRFDYETQLDNVDKFVAASEVPQTRLLYIEYVKIPRDLKSKAKGHTAGAFDSDMSTSDSESGGDTGGGKRTTQRTQKTVRKPNGKAEIGKVTPVVVEDSSNLMLPPLLRMVR